MVSPVPSKRHEEDGKVTGSGPLTGTENLGGRGKYGREQDDSFRRGRYYKRSVKEAEALPHGPVTWLKLSKDVTPNLSIADSTKMKRYVLLKLL